MIIEVLAGIIGFFVLIVVEHFLLPLGFFSIWAFLMIYLYGKIHNIVVWIFLLLAGVALGVSVGLGLGTYPLSAGISILLLFVLKSFTPEEYLVIRYFQYIAVFFTFYVLRFVFGELSINGFVGLIGWNEIAGWLILSLISTGFCLLADRLYLQVRSDSGSSVGRGVGISIRRV